MSLESERAVPDWFDVSRETSERLDGLVALVEKWNPVINLVSKASLLHIWERHVLDSAQLFALAPRDAQHWVDLGSGAGFPGLVIAILAQDARPQLRVTLVEADQRKSTFLSQAARQLDLTTSVVPQRIEDVPPQDADVLSARALAPLTDLCGYARRHLHRAGVALFPKGAKAEDEVAEARKRWQFDLDRTPSRMDGSAAILALRNVCHV